MPLYTSIQQMRNYNLSAKISYVEIALLTLMASLPIATPLTVFLSQHISIFIVSGWKELLLFGATLLAIPKIRDKNLRYVLGKDRVIQLIIAVLVVYCIVSLATWTGIETAVSFAAGSRFLFAYLLGSIVSYSYTRIWRRALKVIMVVGVIVAFLGLLQVLILPKDILTHLGYDPFGVDTKGIPPAYHLVANNQDYVRAQSSLRGPNALGAYLILPLIILLHMYEINRRKIYLFGSFLCGFVLFLSFSRSAWIGASIGIITLAVISFPKKIKKHVFSWKAALVFLLIIGIIGALSKTEFVKTLIFHTSQNQSVNSNEGHISGLVDGTKYIISHPLGGGVGIAGPASVLDGQNVNISENYYLQVGQELGWLGLALLIILTVSMLRFYIQNKSNKVTPILCSSFVALTVTNLLLHTWADEVVAITWWLLAGIGAGVILNEKRKHYDSHR